MKQTIILLAGIILLGLAGLVTISATTEHNTHYSAMIVEQQDANLDIEDWMIEDEYWTGSSDKMATIEEEKDSDLVIETWMVEESYWN